MGIFGAMNTAVSGLRAQSYALENISGNIANSQTVGYKRQDTAFRDLISGDSGKSARNQTAGMVLASSVATNTVQGDITPSSTATHMAINGDGYFVIARPSGTSDGNIIFDGTNLYTRRGDFEVDPNGYLVNGAGYYLMGFETDQATGNPIGNVPEVIQIKSDFLPAVRTTTIDYSANLADYPLTGNANPTIPRSELLNEQEMTVNPRVTGTPGVIGTTAGTVTITDPADLIGSGIADGAVITIAVNGGTAKSFTIGTDAGEYNTLAALQAAINADADLEGVTASITGDQLSFTADSTADDFALSGTGLAGFGLADGSYESVPPGTGTVVGADNEQFIDSSIAGQAITVYDANGTPVNVQFRWAKVASADYGGTDTWNLFYLTDSSATGNEVAWQNVGVDFTFDDAGNLTSPTSPTISLPNLTVNGVSVGDITFDYGENGLTQYYNANGVATPNIIQDGIPAGNFVGISISQDGKVLATYSNNRTVPIAQIPLVTFNGDPGLARLDGGAYAVTQESGEPIYNASGSIVSEALEASNTDIADEFSKLIITQQAYSANTRIISTSDEMLREALSVVS